MQHEQLDHNAHHTQIFGFKNRNTHWCALISIKTSAISDLQVALNHALGNKKSAIHYMQHIKIKNVNMLVYSAFKKL